MTLVRIRRTRPRPDGALTGAAGLMYFRPTRARVVTGTAVTEVLPIAFPVTLDPDGSADVELAPTAADWVWEVTEKITGTPSALIYVAVPDGPAVAYSALVRVDPASLDPAAVPAPIWYAYVDELASTAAQAQAEAVAAATGFSIGTVTTTAPGTDAGATISGQAPNRKLNLELPRGQNGPPLSASVVGTVTGPETPGATGAKGDKGDKGDAGPWTTGVALVAEDLNTLLTPGQYRQFSAANATPERNYPFASSCGIEVFSGQSATELLMRVTAYSGNSAAGRMMALRRYGSSTWSPWVYYRSSRFDQTAGRAEYEWDEQNNRDQLTYGDTGTRDITASFSQITSGAVQISRSAYSVTLIFSDVVFGSLSGTVEIAQPPVGFTPPINSNFALMTSTTMIRAFVASALIRIYGVVSGSSYSGTITYRTNTAWPITLPGNAVGSIPNL